MFRVLKIELKKAFGNKLFLLTLALGIVLVAISAYQNIDNYFQSVDMNGLKAEVSGVLVNPSLPVSTPYILWIGGDYQFPMTSLFYLLLPLMAALAFGWSYCVEKKSGYEKNVIIRSNKKHYFLAKYITVFLAGGAVVAIPLIVSFLTVACFVPAYTPDIFYQIYYRMSYHFMSGLFYSAPLLYIVYVIVLDFVFSGLIATASLAITFFVKNRFAVVLLPFLLLLGVHYLQEVLNPVLGNLTISPIEFLKAYDSAPVTWWVVFPSVIVLFFLTFGITYLKGARDDVF